MIKWFIGFFGFVNPAVWLYVSPPKKTNKTKCDALVSIKYFGIKPLTLVSFWLDPPNKQKKIKRKPVIFSLRKYEL